MNTVLITDRFYRDKWLRKIGDGEWENMPLEHWGGRSPVIFLNPNAEWIERTTLVNALIADLWRYGIRALKGE